MSRVAKVPITIPAGVEVKISDRIISVKGPLGQLTHAVHKDVNLDIADSVIKFAPKEGVFKASAQAGTARVLVNNMILGVTKGFKKTLILKGVGYRAAVKGNSISLTLGYSHPVEHSLPEGVKAECPSQTEVVLNSTDKQLLGQVAADIRSYRQPEPYKGKGIRYSDEVVRIKEAKKK